MKKATAQNGSIKVISVNEASNEADVILIAATSSAAKEISEQLGDVKNKIIIDAMNSIAVESAGYSN